jgi:hypothetical protein
MIDRRLLAATAAMATMLAGMHGLHAQSMGQGGSIVGNGFAPVVQPHEAAPAAKPAPGAALPGAINTAPAAPAEKLATDMSPNDALFDAIDRGDMPAVRDALSRGADLGAQNVLGMTPIELSVDLGRNAITFLLLSERGADAPASKAPATAVAALKPARHARPATTLASSTRAMRPTQAAPAGVRYADTNPGTPIPQAGFLGFGNP